MHGIEDYGIMSRSVKEHVLCLKYIYMYVFLTLCYHLRRCNVHYLYVSPVPCIAHRREYDVQPLVCDDRMRCVETVMWCALNVL